MKKYLFDIYIVLFVIVGGLILVFKFINTGVFSFNLISLFVSSIAILVTIKLEFKRVAKERQTRFEMFVVENLQYKYKVVRSKLEAIIQEGRNDNDNVFENELLNEPYFSKMFEQYYYKISELTMITDKIDVRKLKQLEINFQLQIKEIIFKIYNEEINFKKTNSFEANFDFI